MTLAERKLGSTTSRLIRDLWIGIGVTLLLFAALEGAYVGQRAVRAAWFGSDAQREARRPDHPYVGQAWYQDFIQARDGAREKFDPWRIYWAHSLARPNLNVDSMGRRVSLQAPATRSPVGNSPRRIYFLGGSAMWGFTSRDSLTIPSLVAHALDSAGVRGVEVVNLAQSGYVLGQEVATLTQELAQGRVPAIAVFYDGINDIRTTQLYREPGHAFFEPRFTHLYEVEAQRGFFKSFFTPGERSRLIARLLQALGARDPWAVAPQTPDVCPRLGAYYQRMLQIASGLAQAWDFKVLFIQQPTHATTRKTLTPFEKSFMGPDWHVKYTRDCAEAIDFALSPQLGTSYVSYARMFDDSPETVFLDRFGHVTEAAHRRIAAALVREIIPRLARGDSTGLRRKR